MFLAYQGGIENCGSVCRSGNHAVELEVVEILNNYRRSGVCKSIIKKIFFGLANKRDFEL